ncbi:MAG: OmpH family outer membrane protein, partial [Bacteroidota bacterium]
MKKRLTLLVPFLFLCFQLHAKKEPQQAPAAMPIKLGYTSLEYLISCLPETPQVESTIKSFEKQLEQRFRNEVGKLQQQEQAYRQGYETMTEAVRQQKETELKQLQTRCQQMQVDLNYQLKAKKDSLLLPLYEKVQAAIEQVQKEKQYTHIFNVSMSGVAILICAEEQF